MRRRRRRTSRNVKWVLVCLTFAFLFWPSQTGMLPLPEELPIFPVRTLRVFDAGELHTMAVEDYVACVVAAEMPAAYALEALEAQAVAARTRALSGTPCASHPEADICTDSGCCQAFLSEAGQRARWGDAYAEYHAKVCDAADTTRDLILTYDGAPILVLYHAVSGGHTEDVEQVYSQALPYLRGVVSEGEETASRYETEQRFTRKEFADTLNVAHAKAGLTPEKLEQQVRILTRSESGRVTEMRLGGATVDGRALRKALGLYSTAFTITFTKSEVVIDQRGYGHGVGMSQAGAQAMALTGSSYAEILTHYYTGVQIVLYNP